MAVEEGSLDREDQSPENPHLDTPSKPPQAAAVDDAQSDLKDEGDDEDDDEDEDGEDEEEEDEPRLKYATLTKSLGYVFRNGDAISACLVAGDKMILGTHDGIVHVFLLPSLHPLKNYRAHKNASVTSLSISPYPPPLPTFKPEASSRLATVHNEGSDISPSNSPKANNPRRQPPVPRIPSNEIYIASASIDGHVCVASLVDVDDVLLRNFARPLQSVALSPNYRVDKSYLSGGQAGSLILTVGGQRGKATNATTTGATAAASSWFGSVGLGASTGTDRVLHSGEGTISTIKWSRTGKYVLWVTEEGVKIMRSHSHMERADSGIEWKRISHISRPDRAGWEEMAGVWKARADWVDRNQLEADDASQSNYHQVEGKSQETPVKKKGLDGTEEVIVGWGDTVWLIKVYAGTDNGKKEDIVGKAEITASVRFNDCIISGVSMYTNNLILVLAHMEKKQSKKSKNKEAGGKKGRPQRLNGLEPELRIVDILSKEEVDSDTLQMSRFEALSSLDYHLCMLPPTRALAQMSSKGYLEAISGGVTAVGSGLVSGAETLGQGMYDVTMYGPRKLGVNRIFSGAESIRSGKAGTESSPVVRTPNHLTSWIPGLGTSTITNDDVAAVATSQGAKIFVFSMFDCIAAIKRNRADKMQWLVKMKQYQRAWELIDQYPEAAGPNIDDSDTSSLMTPSKASSFAQSGSVTGLVPVPPQPKDNLADFFAESFSISSSQRPKHSHFSKSAKEKRRIGTLWVQQLLDDNKWTDAGEVAAKVIDDAKQWEDLIWRFIKNKKFDEISPHVPTFQITPTLKPLIYEIILGHYVSVNRPRFGELIEQWPSDLFDISSVTSAIQGQLDSDQMGKDSDDWRILQECLAKLSLDNGNYREALKCYVRVQDADAALSLIRDHHLVEAVADDIANFVLLRIPPSELTRASRDELDELSSDPIQLLVEEASHGVVEIEDVVNQLKSAPLILFLFFYLRALWRGDGTVNSQAKVPIRGRSAAAANLAVDEGRLLVEQFADTALEVFAEYDRHLLMEFLHGSSAYTFDKAVRICEQRQFIEELVYLLSKTGAVKKALFLIIDEMNDVSKAIEFAKEQDDPALWDDFLDYSMSRPHFISGLLAEIGTAINPIDLVRRIPSGLEIEGLKDGLQKMLREYDLQHSISSGVAKVFSSEVAVAMRTLRRGRRQGIRFEIPKPRPQIPTVDGEAAAVSKETMKEPVSPSSLSFSSSPGFCAGCDQAFTLEEQGTLVGFACGHVYHLLHLLYEPGYENERELSLPKLHKDDSDAEGIAEYSSGFTKSVRSKVENAKLLRDKIEDIGGCRVCHRKKTPAPLY